MEIFYERCCGIDVHKRMIVACLRTGRKSETRTYGTYTDELRDLTRWLKSEDCQMAAMESTGPYWKPLYNILEMEELPAVVVNAAHMKALPGRKTDVADAAWIADLLQHGLLRASFIPERKQRELRELTRYRKSKAEERAREVNRLQKVLEGANIKLASALSDITGQAANAMLRLVTEDKPLTTASVAACMQRSMKSSAQELRRSLDGVVTELQRELIREILHTIQQHAEQIIRLDALIERYMDTAYTEAAEALVALPGIAQVSARVILAEIGVDMSRFPSANHLCSWAGICPGNNESAGKRKSGRTTQGNAALKSTIVQCAVVAAKDKDSYFHAQYQRLVVRRGKKPRDCRRSSFHADCHLPCAFWQRFP